MNSKDIQQSIEQFLAEILDGTDVFLLKLDINAKNDIKVYLDADSGLGINTISQINRKLYKMLEESALIPENDFSIEVGSLGVDEPLMLDRQYKKHVGRQLEVTTEESVITGQLKEVSDEAVTIEVVIDKKKKETELNTINFNQIKKAIVLISF